jgi:phosphatidate cytidylyltransferase
MKTRTSPGNIIEFKPPDRGKHKKSEPRIRLSRVSVNYLGYAFAVLYYAMLPLISSNSFFFILITSFITGAMVIMVLFHGKLNILDCAVTLFGFFYVAFMLSFIYQLRMHPQGNYFVWLVFLSAFGCDSCAYFAGRAFGKHKLAPYLSPNKTIEGAIGGIFGGLLLSTLFGWIISKTFQIEGTNIILYCSIVGAVGAVFATFGDLAASSIKRFTLIKDFGNLFPGHGGVLDRFDSVLFAAPMMYMMLVFLIYSRA